MISLFGEATDRLCKKLDAAAFYGEDVEMESLFSRLTLDIIGRAVFNYDFDSLTNDTGIVEVLFLLSILSLFSQTSLLFIFSDVHFIPWSCCTLLLNTFSFLYFDFCRLFTQFWEKQRIEVLHQFQYGRSQFGKTFHLSKRKLLQHSNWSMIHLMIWLLFAR